MAANEEWHVYVIMFPSMTLFLTLMSDILQYCYLQTINLIKHQQRLTENLKFKIFIMILESYSSSILSRFSVELAICIQMMIFKPLSRY